ncbi:DUF6538 domain-containing protein [Methylobacterium sp. 4-46]|uniref:DUF6538 domain-containing protein n=1 Tax=Methylobacterium sp. (strain 4-46) TaxID=426117 RepID=UPI0039F48CDB
MGVWYLRQRTPADLLKLKGLQVSLPVAGTSATVKIVAMVLVSLRTREPAEARTRQAGADAAPTQVWDARSRGPSPLTQRQVTALAG